jgi:hypothetical protein
MGKGTLRYTKKPSNAEPGIFALYMPIPIILLISDAAFILRTAISTDPTICISTIEGHYSGMPLVMRIRGASSWGAAHQALSATCSWRLSEKQQGEKKHGLMHKYDAGCAGGSCLLDGEWFNLLDSKLSEASEQLGVTQSTRQSGIISNADRISALVSIDPRNILSFHTRQISRRPVSK